MDIDDVVELLSKAEEDYRQLVHAFRRYNIADQLIENYIERQKNLIQTLKTIVNLLSQ